VGQRPLSTTLYVPTGAHGNATVAVTHLFGVILFQFSLLVQVRIPDTPRDARCTITSGVTLTRRLDSAGRVARVELWSLAGVIPDTSTPGKTHGLRREAHLSSFDVRPGEVPVQRSEEFACPPPRSLQTFEVSCVDEDDACSVEVWQGLFRVEVGK
jgi:hypothetical protein